MTLSTVVVSVLLLLQTPKGSIEGTVINSITNKPAAGAQITATKVFRLKAVVYESRQKKS